MTTAKTPAAVSLSALLALTACSGGSSLYEFTEPMMEPTSSIEFRVPAELLELNEDYAENRVFDSVTVSAVDSEDAGECVVEYRVTYANGGLERLLAYIEETADDPRFEGNEEERMAFEVTGRPLDEIELSEDYSSAVVPLDCAASPSDGESTSIVYFSQVIGDESITLARTDVAVMQGGELYIHETEVRDWQLDSNGNWIPQ
ncbi:hypothetical protein [Nocardiopsis aegyptia]|uniref:Lipoprotein n=1 Tax=Nocardiopsis aegyptia TaxID=220378 RepID=A0A7Z0EML8_9ACTN|nr:hypothetical protein [Nocardiopsis aegyptia]NYJ34912.1 hypothetical protein [Nocardiopsis aegyptia]